MRGITMIIILLGAIILAMMTSGCGGDGNAIASQTLGDDQWEIIGPKLSDEEAGRWDDPAPEKTLQTREVPPGSLLHEVGIVDYSKVWFGRQSSAAHNGKNLIFSFSGGKYITTKTGEKKFSQVVGLTPDNKRVWYTHYRMDNGTLASSLACDGDLDQNGQGNLFTFVDNGGGWLFSFDKREMKARRQIGMGNWGVVHLIGAPNKGVWCINEYAGLVFYNLNCEVKKTIYLDDPIHRLRFDVAVINNELIVWNFVYDDNSNYDTIAEYNITRDTRRVVTTFDERVDSVYDLFYLPQVDQLGVVVTSRDINGSYSTAIRQITRDGQELGSVVIDDPAWICQSSTGEIITQSALTLEYRAVFYSL